MMPVITEIDEGDIFFCVRAQRRDLSVIIVKPVG